MVTVLAALGIVYPPNTGLIHKGAPRTNALAPIALAKLVNAAKIRTSDPQWQQAQKEVSENSKLFDKNFVRNDGELQAAVLRNGPEGTKKITLTFDDGPHPGYTESLLKILKQEKVPATFFLVGFMAQKSPDLVRQIKAAGFEIGSHTYSHVTLTKLSPEQRLTEYQASINVLNSITGAPVRYFRPPGGDFDPNVIRDASRFGMRTVLWTNDPADYRNPSPNVQLDRMKTHLESGDIILLHDGSKSTLATLSEFIRYARKKGYQFVGLDDLRPAKLATKAYQTPISSVRR